MSNFESIRTDLQRVVGQLEVPEGKTLADILSQLDEAAGSSGLPAQFAHYLERRSYLKALAWLDNPATKHEA